MNKPVTRQTFLHIPVLLRESIDALAPLQGKTVVDCTGGGGGHTQGFLEAVGKNGKVICMDRDLDALAHLQERFAEAISQQRLSLHHSQFSAIDAVCAAAQVAKVDAIFADLGVSSFQLDTAARGFSFAKAGDLDMRMNQSAGLSAKEILMQAEESFLCDIFRRYGEEPAARHYARAIVQARQVKPIDSTLDLAKIIEAANPFKKPSKKHPATRVFQALRIHVNSELEEVETLLKKSLLLLGQGGKLGMISFHSLEDRLIKDFMNDTCRGPRHAVTEFRHLPIKAADAPPKARTLRPFPMIADEEEIQKNPRSRSAKLRIMEILQPI